VYFSSLIIFSFFICFPNYFAIENLKSSNPSITTPHFKRAEAMPIIYLISYKIKQGAFFLPFFLTYLQ